MILLITQPKARLGDPYHEMVATLHVALNSPSLHENIHFHLEEDVELKAHPKHADPSVAPV